VPFRVVAPRARVGTVTPGWSDKAVALVAPAGRTSVVAWPGLRLVRSIDVPSTPPAARPAGSVVGSLAVSTADGTIAELPLRLGSPLPSVPSGWAPARG